jgi:hypothetical protein
MPSEIQYIAILKEQETTSSYSLVCLYLHQRFPKSVIEVSRRFASGRDVDRILLCYEPIPFEVLQKTIGGLEEGLISPEQVQDILK